MFKLSLRLKICRAYCLLAAFPELVLGPKFKHVNEAFTLTLKLVIDGHGNSTDFASKKKVIASPWEKMVDPVPVPSWRINQLKAVFRTPAGY